MLFKILFSNIFKRKNSSWCEHLHGINSFLFLPGIFQIQANSWLLLTLNPGYIQEMNISPGKFCVHLARQMMISLCLVKIKLLFRQPLYAMRKHSGIFLPVDVANNVDRHCGSFFEHFLTSFLKDLLFLSISTHLEHSQCFEQCPFQGQGRPTKELAVLFSNLFLCNYPLVIDIWSFKFEVGGKFAGLHTRKRRNKGFLEKHHHLLNCMKATLIKSYLFSKISI